MSDLDFTIEFTGFNEGNSPLAHLDEKTFIGNKGQAGYMKADIISKPGFLTQGPALANLVNSDSVGELIRYIMDQPTAADTTYGIGTSKLFKISSTTVINNGTWPQTVTGMTEGESVTRLKTNIYAFYNKASGGDILKMPLSSETIDATWGSVADQALENAPHPSAAKEDILVFGNGRYLGVYVEGLATLDTHKLDFGEGSEIADVLFSANMWWIAVNYGEGKRSQVYLYDGSAISSVLSDEAAVGEQEIGFLYVQNGTLFVCYKDLTSNVFTIGFIKGRQIQPLRYFKGSLPDHRQKSLYLNTILFISDNELWSFGSSVDQLPLQISKLSSGGLSTVGTVASPFGTPIISSTDGTSFQLAQFSKYATDSIWKSVFNDVTKGRMLGKVHTVIVQSKPLVGDARCDITIEGNQGEATTSNSLEYSGAGTTRKIFRTIILKSLEDLRVVVDFSNGDSINDCPIRKIILEGIFTEK